MAPPCSKVIIFDFFLTGGAGQSSVLKPVTKVGSLMRENPTVPRVRRTLGSVGKLKEKTKVQGKKLS